VEITETILIDAPVARVWDVTLDIEALPTVTPTVTAVERLDDGPVQVGSQARLSQPGLPKLVWTVEEVDAPRRFVWATRLAGVRMLGVHELADVGDGRCELTLRVVFEGRGAGLLGRIGRRSIAKSIATEAAGFARMATGAAA
jgi:uncharacterized membrane protein